MNKTNFIEELVKKTGLSKADGEKVNEVVESNFLLGKSNNNKIVSEISAKLGISEDKAKEIFEKVMEILGGGLLDKLKHPFGSQDT